MSLFSEAYPSSNIIHLCSRDRYKVYNGQFDHLRELGQAFMFDF